MKSRDRIKKAVQKSRIKERKKWEKKIDTIHAYYLKRSKLKDRELKRSLKAWDIWQRKVLSALRTVKLLADDKWQESVEALHIAKELQGHKHIFERLETFNRKNKKRIEELMGV